MIYKLLIILFIFLAFKNIEAKEVKQKQAIVDIVECDNDLCVQLEFTNDTNKSICIEKQFFKFTDFGLYFEDVFNVIDKSSNLFVESSNLKIQILSDNNSPRLIFWVPKKRHIKSISPFSIFYELEDGKTYLIEYEAPAFFCENYETRSDYFLIKGEFSFKKNT